MKKRTLEELDNGVLDAMWSMLQLGKLEPCVTDVEVLIENVDKIRKILIQKSSGQQSRTINKDINFDEAWLYIDFIVLACLSLRVSGVLDKLLEMMKKQEGE